MRKKHALWIIPMILLATTIASQTAVASPAPSLAVSPIVRDISSPGGPVPVGDPLTVNITVADVQKLWAYQLRLFYNTSILTFIDFTSYAPFTEAAPSGVNETGGYVDIARTSYYGDPTGLTVNPGQPAVRVCSIDFEVKGLGTTKLYLDPKITVMATAIAGGIKPPPEGNLVLVSGYFSNTEEIKLHDVAITDLTLNSTSVRPGGSISITVDAANEGFYPENCSISVSYDPGAHLIRNETNIYLEPGQTTTKVFTWTTTDVIEGDYVITARIHVKEDNNPANNIRSSDTITVRTPVGASPLVYAPYILAGIAVVAVVVWIVFRLRKPK